MLLTLELKKASREGRPVFLIETGLNPSRLPLFQTEAVEYLEMSLSMYRLAGFRVHSQRNRVFFTARKHFRPPDGSRGCRVTF